MSVEPTILHADLDAFFASVEQRDDSGLRGRPVIVGPGVVLAASYEARAKGVRSAMGAAEARRLCPEAVVVPARFKAYVEASKAVRAVFKEATPRVHSVSIDEAWLDVAGLRRISGTPAEIAERLRRDVREQVGLPITVGVARTRFLAKVASGVAKPDGLLVVPPDGEEDFLFPLAVQQLWGVGPSTAAKLQHWGVRTAGQAAHLGEASLIAMLGKASGRHLHALLHSREPPPLRQGRSRHSIGAQSALGRRRRSPAAVDAVVVGLADRLGRRLRAAGRACRTIVLRVRFDDFSRATRSHTLTVETEHTATILATARDLLAETRATIERRGLTLVGSTLTNLEASRPGQLTLPFERAGVLDAAIDEVRGRFGTAAITRAVLLRAPPARGPHA